MSLLNQMLKDLEQRKSPPERTSQPVLLNNLEGMPRKKKTAVNRYQPYYHLGFACILLSAAAYLLWPTSEKNISHALVEKPRTNTALAATTPAPPLAAAKS